MVKTEIVYLVKELKNGLLLDPEDGYGDIVFNKYGYETEEEALAEILKKEYYYSGNLIILRKVEFNVFDED